LPVAPSLPLSEELRAAYEKLYDTIEAAIEDTTDLAALEALNAVLPQVDDILTKDRMYRLHANTALFEALLQQINDTNVQLKELQEQVASVASRFSDAADVIDAISRLFALLPGI
jgi:superfamily I DNA and RNA helicase